MKVIDLLNKIANGEEIPEKFKFAGQTFEKQGSYIEDEDGDSIFNSMCTDFSNINEEIEVMEEDNFTGMKCYQDGREIYKIYSQPPFKCRDDVEMEEDKKIEKHNTGLDNGEWHEESVRKDILKNKNIEDYLIRVMKEVDAVKFKTFEIIDKVNKGE